MIDLYCERVGPEFWSEPFNAVTNLAFFVAAYFAWRLARGAQMLNAPVWWLIALIVAIGTGSFLFHTLATPRAMVADVAPILLFQLSFLWIYVGVIGAYYGALQTSIPNFKVSLERREWMLVLVANIALVIAMMGYIRFKLG